MKINNYKVGTSRFTITAQCGHQSTPKYVRAHNGLCRACHEDSIAFLNAKHEESRTASREEQNARYIDCGPQAWDDKD